MRRSFLLIRTFWRIRVVTFEFCCKSTRFWTNSNDKQSHLSGNQFTLAAVPALISKRATIKSCNELQYLTCVCVCLISTCPKLKNWQAYNDPSSMITSIVRSVFQNQFYRLTLLTFQKSHYLVQKMSSAAANGIRNERFSSQKVICLFDMDGTLTKSRQNIEHSMAETLHQLRKRVTIGVISGSDIGKIAGKLFSPNQNLTWIRTD